MYTESLDIAFFGENYQRSGGRLNQLKDIKIMREVDYYLKINGKTKLEWKQKKIDIFRQVAGDHSTDDHPIEPKP